MSNKKQTAVEWLMDNIYIDPSPELYAKFAYAKELEKGNISNFANDYADQVMGGMIKRAEEYYKETYGE